MNKMDLAVEIAQTTGMTKKASEQVVLAVFDAISNTLASGEKVSIAGFGTFEVRERPARVGRNPRTGESVPVPASRAVAFKAGKNLKERL
nr:HU family DNA-binding protein [bacterium]